MRKLLKHGPSHLKRLNVRKLTVSCNTVDEVQKKVVAPRRTALTP
eukprot:CAMPEP_0177777536 /NCGR_PEP_ID=MMETSP0491_2-20121128/15423_1 /TAXON_ID=63592 /ORGANISM="Tetraselmis chuii, Strain PLY429" /LENGTH=44 /DNA_ID= /DNA_START= /DNA_END= /DNA_ORIENTATION=